VVRKKLALTLQSEKTDGERVYRVVAGDDAAEPQAARLCCSGLSIRLPLRRRSSVCARRPGMRCGGAGSVRALAAGIPHGGPVAADDRKQNSGKGFGTLDRAIRKLLDGLARRDGSRKAERNERFVATRQDRQAVLAGQCGYPFEQFGRAPLGRRRGKRPAFRAGRSKVIAPPSKEATTDRRSTASNANSFGVHSVGGAFLA
jgi:hypothetical protein